jgi:hypothetical protein
MGRERSGDYTETGGSAVMPISHDFSTRATGGDFEATFASAEPSPEKTVDSTVSTRPAQGMPGVRVKKSEREIRGMVW